MKGGVETGDLHKIRALRHQRANGGDIMRLMMWRQRLQRRQLAENGGRGAFGGGESRAPMDDAMGGTGGLVAEIVVSKPIGQGQQRVGMIAKGGEGRRALRQQPP